MSAMHSAMLGCSRIRSSFRQLVATVPENLSIEAQPSYRMRRGGTHYTTCRHFISQEKGNFFFLLILLFQRDTATSEHVQLTIPKFVPSIGEQRAYTLGHKTTDTTRQVQLLHNSRLCKNVTRSIAPPVVVHPHMFHRWCTRTTPIWGHARRRRASARGLK